MLAQNKVSDKKDDFDFSSMATELCGKIKCGHHLKQEENM